MVVLQLNEARQIAEEEFEQLVVGILGANGEQSAARIRTSWRGSQWLCVKVASSEPSVAAISSSENCS